MEKEDRTNAWVAEKSGLSAATISRILEMVTIPGIDTVDKIAKVFGVDPAEMLKAQGKKAALKKHEEKLNSNAEMRRLMKLQIEDDLLRESYKKMQEDILEIKSAILGEKTKAMGDSKDKTAVLEHLITLKSIEIETQKKKLNLTEKLVRIFDGTPESAARLRDAIASNSPITELELLEAKSLIDLAQEIVGPRPDLLIEPAELMQTLKLKKSNE